MRVIAGEYKGRRLKSVPGSNTRPTTDKVKESLFNIIGPFFDGGISLDMFAGSGGLSIEAVSRGIDRAVLFEKNRKALDTIKENIDITKEPEKFTVYAGDARKNLRVFASENPNTQFSLVSLDPPYAEEKTVADITEMIALQLVNEETIFVCEMAKENTLPEQIGPYGKWKRAVYGTIAIEMFDYYQEG